VPNKRRKVDPDQAEIPDDEEERQQNLVEEKENQDVASNL